MDENTNNMGGGNESNSGGSANMEGGNESNSGGSAGPVIGIIVILAIIILGGLYFWGQGGSDTTTVEEINTESTSDDTASIEADLEDTNIEDVDSELNAS